MISAAAKSNVLGRALRAFQAGDVEAAASLMAPNIVWHSPGRSQPAAGSHRGLEHVLEAFRTIATQPGELSLETVDALSGREHEAVLYRHRRKRPEATLDANICLVARVVNGKLVEVWEHIYDIHEFDDFYGERIC